MFAGKASFLFAIQGLKCQLFSFKINSETKVKKNFYQKFSKNNIDPSENAKKKLHQQPHSFNEKKYL